MANTEIIDIGELYLDIFGFFSPPYPNIERPKIPDFRDNPEGEVLSRNNKVRGNFNFKAPNGAEYRMPTALIIPAQLTKDGKVVFKEERIQLPNEPILSIKGSKEIKVTSLNRGGKRGVVKEEFNLNDYDITIKGICINNEEDDYPEEQVADIRRLVEQEGAIKIENFFTRMFNITLVVVKDWDFPRDPKQSFRVQPYSIQLMSDEDFELELT